MIDPVATARGTDTRDPAATARGTDMIALGSSTERRVEIDCGGCAGDSFVALRSHLSTFGRSIGRRQQLRKIDRLKQVLFAIEDADVRTVELVRRTCQEIAIHLFHVTEEVRRVMDSINQCERAD